MLRTLIVDFNKLSLRPVSVTQVRQKGHLSRPHLRNPSWFLRKERKMRDNLVTPENKSFVQELVHDKFGPPALIKGVPSYDQSIREQLVKTQELELQPWTEGVRRTGVIARKIGQYPLWLKNGERIRTTLLQIVDNHVVKYIPPEEYKPTHKPNVSNLSNYGCLLVGAESCDPSTLTKEYCGLFKDSGLLPKKHLVRFIVSPSAAIPVGTPLNVNHYRVGDYIDVRGKTVDHGFQGVVKRHGFKGMPASHGVTKTHRRPGNIGGGGEKGRVWPGTKMPGHMGNRWRIAKGLRIWRINTKYNVMWVNGSAIPGSTNGLVYIYDTILPLRRHKTAPPFPTSFEQITEGPDDIWFDQVHNFKDETITFKPEEEK
ncbi:39S ribosomal protein L3, mitochondrial [Lucilia cuprina]|uniref:39S ribosomal protein L3, mitochondrial n=1 Tax=Lucilia cuprina TaxID=7375 RepID=UPI001F064835|nr:39S ribosomal protein L3, mitochondrial [Lucilia cuprina]